MGQCFKTLEKGQCWRQEADSDAVTLEIQQVPHILQSKASLRGCSYIYLLVATEKCKKMALSYSLRRHLHRKISNSVALKIKRRQLSIILHFLKVRKCLFFFFPWVIQNYSPFPIVSLGFASFALDFILFLKW